MIQAYYYLTQALRLAKLREGFCAPNPAVGAIIVKDEQPLASGYHWAKGYAHAEADALNKVSNAKGATLYVTLEPCCHTNKLTPPCTEHIITSGIKEVFFGSLDPNPDVAGQGIQRLVQAGIPCHHIKLPEIEQLYQPYRFWRTHQRPWVTAKLAVSLDGSIALADGTPAKITGKALQKLTHAERKRCDAILTTVKTIIADDPQLNVRLAHEVITKPLYILDRELNFPATAQIVQTAKNLTLFHASHNLDKLERYQAMGISCVRVTAKNDKLALNEILDHLGRIGIHHLWVEAGTRLFKELAANKQLQQALLYIGNIRLGKSAYQSHLDMTSLLQDAKTVKWQAYEDDVVCSLEF